MTSRHSRKHRVAEVLARGIWPRHSQPVDYLPGDVAANAANFLQVEVRLGTKRSSRGAQAPHKIYGPETGMFPSWRLRYYSYRCHHWVIHWKAIDVTWLANIAVSDLNGHTIQWPYTVWVNDVIPQLVEPPALRVCIKLKWEHPCYFRVKASGALLS